MRKTCLFLMLLYYMNASVIAQDRTYAQHIIDTLSSPFYCGRGYVNNGDVKASEFLVNEFMKIGVKTLKPEKFLYPFHFKVNVFEEKPYVSVGGKVLEPGYDYIVHPESGSLHKKMNIKRVKGLTTYPLKFRKTALLYDTSFKMTKKDLKRSVNADLVINLEKKLTWSVSTYQTRQAGIDVLKTSMPSDAKKIKVNIKSSIRDHTAYNVIGKIEGTEIKDSFIVLTAHYDHLGMMGETLFPGANDNASGVAMMLDLAKHFIKNPPKYSIALIAFAGEEAGLIGSKAYTDNAWDEMPLNKIKFLINLDLMGSGEKGIAVVNATLFKDQFNRLKKINEENNYLSGFKVRGKAANSDHYWFVERGVPGFFFYLMGDYTFYHDVFDRRENLKLSEYYDRSFKLIRDFMLKI